MSISIKSIGIRLKQYLTYKRLAANELGRSSGTSGAQISNIIRAKPYGISKLIAVFETCPDLNPKWLFFGDEAMILSQQQQQQLSEQIATFESNPTFSRLTAQQEESAQIKGENSHLKEEVAKLREENERMEKEKVMSGLTIEAYKKTAETLSMTNKELKELLDFYKSHANLNKLNRSA